MLQKRVFIICPVRNVSEEFKAEIEAYVSSLESKGVLVHYPKRDTNQDAIGINICARNKQAISDADEIHIFWDGQSKGSLFDFGMAFALGKRILAINVPQKTDGKSFQNVMLAMASYL